jgi:selenocysteine lyase/cysteine desulfurase
MPVTEHHANIVPWQMIAKRFDLQIRFFSVTQDYQIDAEDFVRQYRNDVKLVTVGHVSNVT